MIATIMIMIEATWTTMREPTPVICMQKSSVLGSALCAWPTFRQQLHHELLRS